jgi:two-component system, OmpR family, KDP operon response regulator KdpE
MSERGFSPGTDGVDSVKQPLVLVIDDYEALLRVLRLSLPLDGFEVATATTGEEGVRLATERTPDVVCLDLRLGESAGQDILPILRERLGLPVIIMTGVTEEDELLDCLRLGADEIVTKPFLAQDDLSPAIRFLAGDQKMREVATDTIGVGEIDIDPALERVSRRGGESIALSWTEWRLLQVLLSRKGQPVLQQELLSRVWGPRFQGYVKFLRAWMSRLSQKTDARQSTGRLIVDFLGVGYALSPEVAELEPR